MDNAKSIIDIEVNDDQFKEFHKLFLEYKKALGDTPNIWKKTNTEAKSATSELDKQRDKTRAINKEEADASNSRKKNDAEHLASTNDLISALAAHVAMMNKGLEVQREIAKEEHTRASDQEKYNKLQSSADKRANDALEKRNKLIKSMGEGLSSVLGKTGSIGLNFAKWGIGTGLALAGGTFWGMDRLGQSAAADRSTSRGLGVTPGQLRAWRTDFSPYGDPNALLGAASNAYSDPMTRATLMRAGVSGDTIRSGNTSQIAEQTLRGLSAFYQKNQGPNGQQIWDAQGFNNVIGYNEMRQFAATSPQEQAQFFNRLHSDSSSLGNSDRTLRQWQDFSVQLARAGQQIKSTFLDGLSGLTVPMSRLSSAMQDTVKEFMTSGAFKDIIGVLTQGLNDLSQSFKDGAAQRGIKEFIAAISQWAKDGTLTDDLKMIEGGIHQLAKVLGWIIPDKDKPSGSGMRSGALKGGAIGAGLGAVAGPGGAVIGGTLGAAAGGIYGGFANIHGERVSQRGLYWMARLSGNSAAMSDYLSAIAMTESGGRVGAQSKAGAQGLFQLMPSVQKQYGVTDPFSIRQSLRGGSALVSYLMKHYNGNFAEATAAYNAGSGRVDNAIKRYGDRNWLQHLPAETQQYVGRVASHVQSSNLRIQISNTTGGAATVTTRQASGL